MELDVGEWRRGSLELACPISRGSRRKRQQGKMDSVEL
jgi:hypothetical protein